MLGVIPRLLQPIVGLLVYSLNAQWVCVAEAIAGRRKPRKVAVGQPGSDATGLFGVMTDACVEMATYLCVAVQHAARRPQEPENSSTSDANTAVDEKFSQGQMPIDVRGWGMAGKASQRQSTEYNREYEVHHLFHPGAGELPECQPSRVKNRGRLGTGCKVQVILFCASDGCWSADAEQSSYPRQRTRERTDIIPGTGRRCGRARRAVRVVAVRNCVLRMDGKFV